MSSDAALRRSAIVHEPESFPALRSIPFGQDAARVRELPAPELIAAGVAEAKTLEMLLATSEVATNALRHGRDIEDVRVGPVRGRFVCEIIDRAPGLGDPAAGYLAPRAGVGRDLRVARQLTWRLEFFSSPSGFTARVWL